MRLAKGAPGAASAVLANAPTFFEMRHCRHLTFALTRLTRLPSDQPLNLLYVDYMFTKFLLVNPTWLKV